MNNNCNNVIILGSGPAGLTAGIYCGRSNLKPIIFTGTHIGGQLINTQNVDNWPGEEQGILGPNLMDKMLLQAKKFNSTIINENIIKINLDIYPFELYSENNTMYLCKSLIVATGSNPRLLNLSSEKKFMGKGFSTCATCDGPFYKNKNVVVVGGGNTAVEEAIFLSRIAKNVTLVHRSNKLRADKILIEQLYNKSKNIKFKWFCTVKNILGNETVHSIQLYNDKTKQHEIINIDGIFLAVGNIPNTKLFDKKLELDLDGYIKTYDIIKTKQQTSVKGVYAAGDVIDYTYKQAITAASSGCKAAINVEKYLSSL